MKIFLLLIIFLISFAIGAEETKVPCLKKDGSLGVNVFPQYDCKLIKKVVEDPSIKNKQKEKIEEKLAEKLAFKLERGLEEIAILDQYFNQYKTALTEDENVKRDCKLEIISNPCGKKLNAYKFNLLKSKLQAKGNSLSEKMQNIYTKSSGVIDLNKNECPLEAPSGYYTLNAQFDEKVAENLKDFLSNNNKADGEKLWLEAAYKSYPQLKIIKRSNLSNPKFLKEFEEFMKKYDKTKMPNIKAYVLSFFTNPKNQKDLSKGLAQSCTDIKQNIKNYICEDVSNLKMDEETAVNLFNDEENAEELIEISNAFSCEENEDFKDERITPLDNLYEDFISNTEPQLPKGTVKTKQAVVNFCERYNCLHPEVKDTPSCQKGGPVSVDDLNLIYGCGGNFNRDKCGPDQKQWISYLTLLDPTKTAEESREIARQIGVEWRGDEKAISSKKREFSSFTQNFLGVEGTLRAEGRAITTENVAEKLREFNEKNIDPLPQQNRESILANNEGNKVYNMMMRQPKQDEIPHHQVQMSQPFIPSNFVTAKDNEEQKQAVIANSISKFSNAESRGNKVDVKQSAKENDRASELSRIRSELESVVKSMKGSEGEKLATITDSNANYAQPKAASADSMKNMNREERERLESYRANLNDWESRLRTRENDMIERDLRPGNRSTASDSSVNSADNRYNKTSQDNEQASPTQAAANGAQNSPTLKLVKGQGGQERNGGEREVAGEKGQLGEGETESAIVSAENLAKLEKSGLNRLGLGHKDSFIIKVRLSERIYDVPVKIFNHSGKAMYVPLLSKENRDLAKLIFDSPLFNDYRQYQQERLRTQAP